MEKQHGKKSSFISGPPQGVRLIVGLGNPGAAYKNTYHNVGMMAADWLTKKAPSSAAWKKAGDVFEYTRIGNFIMIKPLVFMNESGKAVVKAKKKFGVRNEEILVIHDESDIRLGTAKVSFGRSSAGHRGVASVIQELRGQNFWRMRIGVRSEKNKKKAMEFVLKKISFLDQKKLEEVFLDISEGLGMDAD